MSETLDVAFSRMLDDLSPESPEYAVDAVDGLFGLASEFGASDLHLNPSPAGLEVRMRIDGVLHRAGSFPVEVRSKIVGRFKVLARLLTYRSDIPQEGRYQHHEDQPAVRVSTFPSLYGERLVVRFFGRTNQYQYVDDLGLPGEIADTLQSLLQETAGLILITGPAGSGKTTTAYACLREILRSQETIRNVVTLEDPIEVTVAGAIQSQVDARVGLDLTTGLRYLMRHDPEVIFLGEIRDHQTAEAAIQASFTGHLLISTFHAGSATEALGRLLEMEIEPYLLRGTILGIVSQRLVRRLCDCAEWTEDEAGRFGLPITRYRRPVGCSKCAGSGYAERAAIAEFLGPRDASMADVILERADARTLHRQAVEAGMTPLLDCAIRLVEEGTTSPGEVRRVLGIGRV